MERLGWIVIDSGDDEGRCRQLSLDNLAGRIFEAGMRLCPKPEAEIKRRAPYNG